MQGTNTQTNSKTTCSNKHCPMNLYTEGKVGVGQYCPTCEQRYKQDCYCIYCHQVYFQSTDDGKNWIECDECEGWVHEECADFFVPKNPNGNNNISFKCIKCKKLESKDVVNAPTRRSNVPRQPLKTVKKNQSSTFASIGFQAALKPEEIAEDMKKVQAFLQKQKDFKVNNLDK